MAGAGRLQTYFCRPPASCLPSANRRQCGEQKVGGREQFLASGSDGVVVVGSCGRGNQRTLDPGSPARAAPS